MAQSNIKAEFSAALKTVWDTVTSLDSYAWRSDLERITAQESGAPALGIKFVEYAKGGYPTEFTVTAFDPMKRYEFDMENSNMKGHWTGIFSEAAGAVILDFTEEVFPKKWFMKPFAGLYLKKQQRTYMEDLSKELEKRACTDL